MEHFNKKTQFVSGFIVLGLSLLLAQYLASSSAKLAMYLITGLSIGYVMQRSRLGFAGIVKKLYVLGNASLGKAILFLLVISLLAVAAIQYNAHINGDIIPGISSVKKITMITVIGGFLFGVGMMFAGGCASGTLTDLGDGYFRSLIALLFFCFGSVLGVMHLPALKASVLGVGAKVYMPDYLGYFWSIVFFLSFYAILYFAISKYQAYRVEKGTYKSEDWEEWEKPLDETQNPEPKYSIFSMKTYHKLFIERWSFFVGGTLLSIIFIGILATTGKNWGVTTTFTYWGGWLLQMFGGSVDSIEFFQSEKVSKIMAGGFLADAGSMRNLGIIIGTVITCLLAGDSSIKQDYNLKRLVVYCLGGLLMGYGARLASGCNIGALYAALSAMSLSGIVFGAALCIGGITGLKLMFKFRLWD